MQVNYSFFSIQFLFLSLNASLNSHAQEQPTYKTQEIAAVEVNNGNQAVLASLLMASVRKQQQTTDTSNAYIEVRSFLDEQQVELVEGYYYLVQGSFSPQEAIFKTGRFALYPAQNRYFASHASADILLGFKLSEANPIFPHSPFNVGRKPQKYFRFVVKDSVQFKDQDTLLEIRFIPKKSDGKSFSGTAWINPRTAELRHVLLSCQNCQQLPFTALFPSDSIQNLDFHLQCAFSPEAKGSTLTHLKAIYELTYLSRAETTASAVQHYYSESNLQVYESEQAILLPHFQFQNGVDIYRKIMAFPYSLNFWSGHLAAFPNSSVQTRNQIFYQNATINNLMMEERSIRYNRLFEHPFIPWSEQRILIREDLQAAAIQNLPNQALVPNGNLVQPYHIGVQLFYDVMPTADTNLFLSSCVIDPYETFYHLPVDPSVNCFINMYFDLCEIERRKFAAQCKLAHFDQTEISQQYLKSEAEMKVLLKNFSDEVERGTRKKAMLKWNEVIIKELGIDNLALFGLYQE